MLESRPHLMNRPPPGARRRRRGFTIAELLVSLVILGALLAAVAVATHAVLLSYSENTKIAQVVQTARVVLHRMMSEARTADAIDTDYQRLSIIPPANDDNITHLEYELVDGALYYRRTVGGSETSHTLIASNEDVQVQDFYISRETAQGGEGTYTRSVTARLTLRSGGNVFPVTATACPRRNLPY